MPDITGLMKDALAKPKKDGEEQDGEGPNNDYDPNVMRTEKQMNDKGGEYFDKVFTGMGMVKGKVAQKQGPQVLTFKPEDFFAQIPGMNNL